MPSFERQIAQLRTEIDAMTGAGCSCAQQRDSIGLVIDLGISGGPLSESEDPRHFVCAEHGVQARALSCSIQLSGKARRAPAPPPLKQFVREPKVDVATEQRGGPYYIGFSEPPPTTPYSEGFESAKSPTPPKPEFVSDRHAAEWQPNIDAIQAFALGKSPVQLKPIIQAKTAEASELKASIQRRIDRGSDNAFATSRDARRVAELRAEIDHLEQLPGAISGED